MAKKGRDYLLVAASDFGTTYSGYAFSMRDTYKTDPLKIHANQAWNAGGRQLLSLKTPTCILLNSNKDFDSFGYEAENRYADLVMDGKQDDYYYFHRFKMSLHNNKNVKGDMLLEDLTGKPVPAIDVFALSIRALVKHLMDALDNRGTGVKPNDIKWVLTVPAIWTDNSKQFMRKSAEKAGIEKDHLLISLEPEAAAIYCQHLPTEKLSGAESGFTMSEVGTKYMIVDLGGGTVDITVHEKLLGGGLTEISRATGGDCGGTAIDAEFIQLLAKIFGAPLIHTMKREQPEAYLDLIREFETVKRTIKPSKEGKVNMAIPYATLGALCKKILKEDLSTALLASPYANSISVRGDKMRFDANLFKNLFDKTLKNILTLIKELFTREELESVALILLVGGFSECALLQAEIKKTFSSRRVIVPEESGLTVLKGAVLFGHNLEAIYSRKTRVTYGVKWRPLFDPEVHDQQHYIEINGEARCKNAYDIIIRKNTNVQQGHTVHKNYESTKDKDTVTFTIFASEKMSPNYTDEEGCYKIGQAIIRISDPSKVQSLEVEFMFGNTEMSLHAVETKSGNSCELSFDLI
ncbi:heat shock 70 kDa protein 12B-like isoform X2 [Mytilus galloprovincialis]|uniref:heat shock 70 kDa protein 12B-like isoform X2 n=1 Tax=Mytilus galloprovincialis TaxID=29158 RepID=UPI003F7BA908